MTDRERAQKTAAAGAVIGVLFSYAATGICLLFTWLDGNAGGAITVAATGVVMSPICAYMGAMMHSDGSGRSGH